MNDKENFDEMDEKQDIFQNFSIVNLIEGILQLAGMEKHINNFKLMVSVFTKLNDVILLFGKGIGSIFSLDML